MQKHQKKDLRFQLIEDIIVLYKDETNHPNISTNRAIRWYHSFLQHPSHSSLQKDNKIREVLKRYAHTTQ
jgi:hypothetical protein